MTTEVINADTVAQVSLTKLCMSRAWRSRTTTDDAADD